MSDRRYRWRRCKYRQETKKTKDVSQYAFLVRGAIEVGFTTEDKETKWILKHFGRAEVRVVSDVWLAMSETEKKNSTNMWATKQAQRPSNTNKQSDLTRQVRQTIFALGIACVMREKAAPLYMRMLANGSVMRGEYASHWVNVVRREVPRATSGMIRLELNNVHLVPLFETLDDAIACYRLQRVEILRRFNAIPDALWLAADRKWRKFNPVIKREKIIERDFDSFVTLKVQDGMSAMVEQEKEQKTLAEKENVKTKAVSES